MQKNEKNRSFDSSTEDTDPSTPSLYCTLSDEYNAKDSKPSRTKSIGNSKDGRFTSKANNIAKIDKSFNSVHQGFLTKQGGNIKNWKKRFFTLRTNQVLYYYRDVNKDPQGEIDLNDPSFSIRQGTLEDGCWPKISLDRTMVLVTKGRRYYLYSETIHETDKWMETIREETTIKTIWDTKVKKSYTLPAQGRTATFSPIVMEPRGMSQKQPRELPLSPGEDNKPRAQTLSAKFQALPAVPPKSKFSYDVTQFYGELPVHIEMLAEMRAKVSESDINTYSDLIDVLNEPIPGEAQVVKRRSGLYKCRSVEDFSTSSCYEVSGLLEVKKGGVSLSSYDALYDTACGSDKDELYGQIINTKEECEEPQATNSSSSSSSRPRMELPEITDYCTTVQPIPNSMRRALLPQDPDRAHTGGKTSNSSLGIGVYSILQPEGENGIPGPVPKPRNVRTSKCEDIYDEVPVNEFYDEISAVTRAGLINMNKNTTELQPNKQPINDYEMLTEPSVSTYSQLTLDTTYDEVLRDTKNGTNVLQKNIDLLGGRLTPESPVLSMTRRCATADVPLSPHSTRRKQDPLPPVPTPPPVPQSTKPTLLPLTPRSPGTHLKEPTVLIDDSSTDDYIFAKPKKVSATPYLGPDPLIDYKQTPPEVIVIEDDKHHYETRDIPPYSKIIRANTVSVVKSVGGNLLSKRLDRNIQDTLRETPQDTQDTSQDTQETRDSNSSSSSEVDLSEEEKKLERLKRECNREEKKKERMEGELKMKKKFDEIKKDQELIQQRLEGIRAKNLNMMIEVGKGDTEVAKVTKPVVNNNNNDNEMLRIQIEREKLEIEKERQQLERDKLQMDKERSEMERMRLEHQKLLLEKERLLFEKEKSELARAKLSSSSIGQNSTDSN